MVKLKSCVQRQAGFLCLLVVIVVLGPNIMAQDIQGDQVLSGGGEYNFDYNVFGSLYVGSIGDSSETTVNMLPGAYVRDALMVSDTGILNVFGGTCDWLVSIASNAVIKVYGTNYELDGKPVEDMTEVYMPFNKLAWKDAGGNSYSLTILSDAMVQLPGLAEEVGESEPEIIIVDVDIKPGSSENAVNIRSKGVVPVAFLSNGSFDATSIDPATITISGQDVGLVKTRGKKQALMATQTDVNGDGLVDLLVKLDMQKLASCELSGVCEFSATTYDGLAVTGSDSITLTGRK